MVGLHAVEVKKVERHNRNISPSGKIDTGTLIVEVIAAIVGILLEGLFS